MTQRRQRTKPDVPPRKKSCPPPSRFSASLPCNFSSSTGSRPRRCSFVPIPIPPTPSTPWPRRSISTSESWDSTNEKNLGVRLDGGYLELAIKASDDAFAHAFFLAAAHLGVDARAAFGVNRISSVILKVEDHNAIAAQLWPKGYKDKHGHWVETKIRTSTPPTKAAKGVPVFSRPLPGSVTHDGIVAWRPRGKGEALDAELGVEDLEPRAIADTTMDKIARAVAYATLAYWIRVYLDGLPDWGAILTHRVGGWIARLVREGAAINAADKNLAGACWSPKSTTTTSPSTLIAFLGKLGADADLKVTYLTADRELTHSPHAPVSGWNVLEETFGPNGMAGIRRAMKAGIDVGVLERMSERYVLDIASGDYIDRERYAIPKGTALHIRSMRRWFAFTTISSSLSARRNSTRFAFTRRARCAH